VPEAIPCLYSSKKIQRDASVAAKKQTIQWLFNFIPKYYHKKFKKLLKQKSRIKYLWFVELFVNCYWIYKT